MPAFIQMQDQYRDKGLEIVGVNIGDGNGGPESTPDIKKFAEQMKLNYDVTESQPRSEQRVL